MILITSFNFDTTCSWGSTSSFHTILKRGTGAVPFETALSFPIYFNITVIDCPWIKQLKRTLCVHNDIIFTSNMNIPFIFSLKRLLCRLYEWKVSNMFVCYRYFQAGKFSNTVNLCELPKSLFSKVGFYAVELRFFSQWKCD